MITVQFSVWPYQFHSVIWTLNPSQFFLSLSSDVRGASFACYEEFNSRGDRFGNCIHNFCAFRYVFRKLYLGLEYIFLNSKMYSEWTTVKQYFARFPLSHDFTCSVIIPCYRNICSVPTMSKVQWPRERLLEMVMVKKILC